MNDHGDHHSAHAGPPQGGHGHGGHDHGPPIWRGLMCWLYPILHRNPASNLFAVEVAALKSGDRVLDIGCGPGAAVRAAAPLVEEAVGADPSGRMLHLARRRSRGLPNVRYVQTPAHHLPFEDNLFTAVWTIHSMHHWGDEEAGISEAHRVLASGGRFLVVEQFDPGKPWGVDEAGIHRITTMMRKAGFTDVEWTNHRVGRADEAVIVGRA
jgi:SAM-dependent methyltransferase